MSAKIKLDTVDNGSGVPVIVIDRTYPYILSGFMTLDEWNEACDSIDKVLDEATKYSGTNIRFFMFIGLSLFASMIIGGVIGYFVGPIVNQSDIDSDEEQAFIGAIFGVVLGVAADFVLGYVMNKWCGLCTRGNKGLLDVCRHLIMAVEDVSKLNPNVKFTLMQTLYNGAAKVITNTDEIFDLKTVWIQAIVDGSNSMVANDARHQEDKYQKLDNRRNVLNQALNDISNRHDLDEIQKAKLREKFIEDFV